MGKRCICEICTCGRHRCPHRPSGVINRGDRPCMLSEYANNYIKKHAPPRTSMKPEAKPMQGEGPLSDKTTNRVDYIRHRMEKPFVHQPEQYRPLPGDMDMVTSYKKEYIEKPCLPAKAVKREPVRKIDGRFEGEPTYKADYRKWDPSCRAQLADREPNYQPPSDKFEGQSTFTHDYIRHHVGPRKSLKPPEVAMMSDQPLDDDTNYRKSYIQHPIPPKVLHQKEAWSPPTKPFDTLSTFRRDFQGVMAPKAPSMKPDAVAFQSDQPFRGETTCRTDFKRWPTERPYAHQPEQYIKPQGDMDLRSTTHLHFDMKKAEPAKAKRPQERRPTSAVFDGRTNYSQDFRKWGLGDRVRPTMRSDYNPPQVPFEGMSTFTSHYIKHNAGPARSCKPDTVALMSDSPFAGDTMYRMEFVPKKSDICPAAILDTSQSKYIFREQEPTGHKFYQPIMETVTQLQRTEAPPTQHKIAEIAVA